VIKKDHGTAGYVRGGVSTDWPSLSGSRVAGCSMQVIAASARTLERALKEVVSHPFATLLMRLDRARLPRGS